MSDFFRGRIGRGADSETSMFLSPIDGPPGKYAAIIADGEDFVVLLVDDKLNAPTQSWLLKEATPTETLERLRAFMERR